MKKVRAIFSIIIMLFIFNGLAFNGIAYGASDKKINVTFDGEEKSVTQVSIVKDGKNINVGIPSFVNEDRTLIPIRLVEQLGAEVDWEQKTRTVIVKNEGEEIRLTIDSNKATIGNIVEKLDDKSVPKLVVLENDDARTMVPISFISKRLGYEVDWDGDTKTVFINTEIDRPGIGADIKPVVDLSNKVGKITEEVVNGEKAIVIEGTKDIEYKMIKLKNPERVVVDLLDSTLQGSTFYKFDYKLGFVEGLRVSQFSPDDNYNPNDKIVRVVLDTKDGAVNPDIKIEQKDDKILILPQDNLWDNINYHVDGMGRILTINNYLETNYSIDYDEGKKLMEITIPKSAVNLTPGSSGIKDDLVKDIKIEETSKYMKLVIQFTEEMEYDVLSKNRDEKIVLKMNEKKIEKPSKKPSEDKKEEVIKDKPIKTPNKNSGERLIVIDAGHGGSDSGAVSPNGVREKDLNLDVSLKLDEALKEKGYNTLMTRDKDVFIKLSNRANIANESFADIFISIHANSAGNKSAHGMEVLYNPNHDKANKTRNEERLAKSILDEMIKETGAHNRGIVKRPNLAVLRQTKMPASLVEIGFLSNTKEEKLIIDDEYQNSIVNAIVKGVEKFFGD